MISVSRKESSSGHRVTLPLFPFFIHDHFGKETRAVVVTIGIEIALVEFINQRRPFLGNMAIAKCLRTIEAFLLSARALSLVCRARDLVNSIRSFRAAWPLAC